MALLAIALALAGIGSVDAATTEVVVIPHCDGEQGALSAVTIGSQTLLWSNDETDLSRLKAALGDSRHLIRIIGPEQAPYRCIGGLIFTLQRLGVARAAFITAPKPDGAHRP